MKKTVYNIEQEGYFAHFQNNATSRDNPYCPHTQNEFFISWEKGRKQSENESRQTESFHLYP